jgi:hypothetical protein
MLAGGGSVLLELASCCCCWSCLCSLHWDHHSIAYHPPHLLVDTSVLFLQNLFTAAPIEPYLRTNNTHHRPVLPDGRSDRPPCMRPLWAADASRSRELWAHCTH